MKEIPEPLANACIVLAILAIAIFAVILVANQ